MFSLFNIDFTQIKSISISQKGRIAPRVFNNQPDKKESNNESISY